MWLQCTTYWLVHTRVGWVWWHSNFFGFQRSCKCITVVVERPVVVVDFYKEKEMRHEVGKPKI